MIHKQYSHLATPQDAALDVPITSLAVAVLESPAAGRSIRILIADHHPTIMQMVKRILNAHPGFEVVGEASDGDHAVALSETLNQMSLF